MVGRMLICSMLFSLNVAGQEVETVSQGNTSFLKRKLLLLQQYLDSAACRKVDPRYIEVPAKPWRVVVRYKENAVDVNYDNHINHGGTNEAADWQMHFNPPVTSSVGFWVGYRGTGISYSKSLAKNDETYFSFNTTGAKYGFDFWLRQFNTSAVTLTAKDYKDGEVVGDFKLDTFMPAPVRISSLYLNGYYVFNGHRYSQAAAYNQSVIQRHSAGSLLVGATWFQSTFDYSDGRNLWYVLLSQNTSKIKVHQANIGLGYGYNWVPLRGLLFNVMVMPTVSFYSRVKVYKYGSNFDLSPKEATDNYGEYDTKTRKWENGKTEKSALMFKRDDYVCYWNAGTETDYSVLRFNLDMRLGIVYNWKDYFAGIQAQFDHFSYKKDYNKVGLTEAYVRIALGLRL